MEKEELEKMKALLKKATLQAAQNENEWEQAFCLDNSKRLKQYHEKTRFSEKQLAVLTRIATGEGKAQTVAEPKKSTAQQTQSETEQDDDDIQF